MKVVIELPDDSSSKNECILLNISAFLYPLLLDTSVR